MVIVRSVKFQVLFLCLLSIGSGALRQLVPDGINWIGQWPTDSTNAQDAYQMLAQPGDPPFLSLAEAIDLQRNSSVVFLDARNQADYLKGRIPGARHLPYYDLDNHQDRALEGLTESSLMVIYCEGIHCELSFFLARELQAAGFKNLRIFYGGYPEWEKAGLPIER